MFSQNLIAWKAERHTFLKEQLLENVENPLASNFSKKKKEITKGVENKNHKDIYNPNAYTYMSNKGK